MTITETVRAPVSRGAKVAALLAGALALAVLLALGVWQVQRLAWKEALIATIQTRLASPPVPLAEVLGSNDSFADQEYRPVTASGVFQHQAERHFFATHDGVSGFYVYTPLLLDSGDYLFVNRGFVPYERKEPSTRPEGQVTGRVNLTGLVRPMLLEKPSSIVPDNDPAKNIFYWKDIRAMAETSGLPLERFQGLFVDANDAPNPGGLPIGGVTIIELPNNHLQYAMTWFGLAAALVGVLGMWFWRNRAKAA
jgi:surfeit locus 1 family protein